MNAFILSYFDALIGPSILEIVPVDGKQEDFQLIPDLMNLYENEFFIHIFGNLQTANLIFDVSSMGDRGGVMTFQASIASTKGEINEDIARDILEAFQKEISELTGIQTAIPRRGKPANKQARIKLREIMDGVFRSLPGDIVRLHSWNAKVFIFGEASVGKTSILYNLQETVPKATLPTLNMDATKIKVSNLTMTAYDAPGQENLRVLWKPYLKGQDGLVFVLDSTKVDPESLTKSKQLLQDIISRSSMEKLPLLVLFNKNDLLEPDIPALERELGITSIDARPVKSFSTSALTGDGILAAFEWLADKLIEASVPESMQLGLLFAMWDEVKGIEAIVSYPSNLFPDAQMAATRVFSTSQYVLGRGEFKKVSYSIPYMQMGARVTLFFDYVLDASVRGGRRPILLGVFCSRNIPATLVKQQKPFIFLKLQDIKRNLRDEEFLSTALEGIHQELKMRLDAMEPTMQALRIAELRYEELFRAARDGIIIFNANTGIIIDVNDIGATILGLPRETMVGFHPDQVGIFLDYPEFMEKIHRNAKIKNPIPLEVDIVRAGHERIPVEVNSNMIELGGQKLLQVIFRDISTRKRLEAERVELERIIDRSPVTVVLWQATPGWPVEYITDNVRRFGYTPEDFYEGRVSFPSIVHPGDRNRIHEEIKELTRDPEQKYFNQEYRIMTRDGRVCWVQDRTKLRRNESGRITHHQGILLDITERKEIENELREKETQLLTRQSFTRGLASCTRTFLDTPYDVLIEAVEDLLEASGACRVYITENFTKTGNQIGTRIIAKAQLPDVNEASQVGDQYLVFDNIFADWKQILEEGQYIRSIVDEIPQQERSFFEARGVHDFLIIPVTFDGNLFGVISFENTEKKDNFSDDDLNLLVSIADLVKYYVRKYKSPDG